MSGKKNIISLIPVCVSIMLTVGVMTVFSACGIKDDGTWMHCHDAQIDTAVCGGIMAVLFLLAAFAKGWAVKVLLNLIAVAASIAAFLIPGTIISMCMMNTMRCYTVMQPFVRIMSAAAILFALPGIISALRSRNSARS